MCDSYSPRGDGGVCGCGQHSPLLSLHQWQPARSGYTHGSNNTHARAQLSLPLPCYLAEFHREDLHM